MGEDFGLRLFFCSFEHFVAYASSLWFDVPGMGGRRYPEVALERTGDLISFVKEAMQLSQQLQTSLIGEELSTESVFECFQGREL